MRIVLIEDNESLARGIATALRDLGHAVDCLLDGSDGATYLATQGADVAIVDVNLPGLSGFDLVRALRQRGDSTPVLMLTARGETSDRITGLDAGADDYLVKPFDMAELIARLRALARRLPGLRPVEETLGRLRFDHGARQLFGPQGPIDLARRELALFEYLLQNSGRVIAKEQIGEALYGVGSEIEPNAVELAVSRLRRKLRETGVEIRTARGVGYMLDAGNDGQQ
ncbi:response regulator transcription factor [Aurantimonas sp. A3-2-R12]|uniref:response regulator transcription factor n=1 Tax=Aurantimonas sp. A3-2-R12 TaxID=3114362 RepID=UPI002E1773EE|nr:response regulator transcription factor [Aurantimonas sp. A3-2-R12]